MGSFLTYALDSDNTLVHVDKVLKGAKCVCHCPHCDAPLYAKNTGKVREHHFAHAHGFECEGAYESSLHLLAKEVLIETGSIMLPLCNNKLFPSGLVRIRDIVAEKWDGEYGIKPDVEGIMENGERLIIEFCVSHKVDERKRQIIVENHLKCIEIDISYESLDKEDLRHFLSDSAEDRNWIISVVPKRPISDESFSGYYSRDPIYAEIRDKLKKMFDQKTLFIQPYGELFDLRAYKYDVCEVNTKFKGFKSDLLLYRSGEKDKGYISINIRGRRRSYGYKRPRGLRVMDVVLGWTFRSQGVSYLLETGCLCDTIGVTIYYDGV